MTYQTARVESGRMKPRITLITLGVDDLERSLAFYREGLGWPSKGIVGTERGGWAPGFPSLQVKRYTEHYVPRIWSHPGSRPAEARP